MAKASTIIEVDVSEATRRHRGFMAMALHGGSSLKAAESSGIPGSTLREWRRDHPDEYERVCRELAPRLEQVAVQELQAFIIQASQTKLLALQKTHAALAADMIPERDLGGLLRNIAVAEAVAIDKTLALTGRPTQVIEHRSPEAIIKRLASLGAVVDGTATEVEQIEAPPDKP